jgi:hypothetical protein
MEGSYFFIYVLGRTFCVDLLLVCFISIGSMHDLLEVVTNEDRNKLTHLHCHPGIHLRQTGSYLPVNVKTQVHVRLFIRAGCCFHRNFPCSLFIFYLNKIKVLHVGCACDDLWRAQGDNHLKEVST